MPEGKYRKLLNYQSGHYFLVVGFLRGEKYECNRLILLSLGCIATHRENARAKIHTDNTVLWPIPNKNNINS